MSDPRILKSWIFTHGLASLVSSGVLDLAAALSEAIGGPAPVVTGGYRLGDVRHITADTARLRSQLAWRPEVGFEAGVREFATAPLRG